MPLMYQHLEEGLDDGQAWTDLERCFAVDSRSLTHNFQLADNAPEAIVRRLPKMHCTGSAGEW